MSKIVRITAREILDSRGNPTVEAEATTQKTTARASVPSGASTGTHEAYELRDHNPKRYFGKGVLTAVSHVNNKLNKTLRGMNVFQQEEIDKKMNDADGTPQKLHLGANAILAASMACCRAAAQEKNIPLAMHIAEISENRQLRIPMPALNIINGGKHAGNKLDMQEYLILPTGAKTFAEALRMSTEVYHQLKEILNKNFGIQSINVGDEGGFAPQLACIEEPFDYMLDAIEKTGYSKQIKLGIDAASSTFYRHGKYCIEGQDISAEKLMEKYKAFSSAYPLVSIEDPFYEDDFENFSRLTAKIGKRTQIVGDDLTVTNPARIRKAAAHHSCNCLLLKINQIGTITQAIESAKIAFENKWKVMVSHRSGDTEDSFIADFAAGIGAGQIKSGAPCRSERVAKYNQLLRLEELFGKKAKYGGDF